MEKRKAKWMKYFVDARDEKRYDFFKKELSGIWKRAEVSQKRFMTYGALATMMWAAGVGHLTPIQRARTLWPHAIMFVIGSSIAGTVNGGLKKAYGARQGSLQLLKELGRCRTGSDIENITPKALKFMDYYKQYSGYDRSY